MKRCSKCKEIKPESEFYKDKRTKDGLKCQCKECHCKTCIATRDAENARRICREYMRRRRKKYPELVHAEDRARELVRPKDEKKKARTLLNNAVKRGEIKRPEFCQVCGASGTIHGHHTNYSRPYEVEWLCGECHGKRHRKRTKKDTTQQSNTDVLMPATRRRN